MATAPAKLSTPTKKAGSPPQMLDTSVDAAQIQERIDKLDWHSAMRTIDEEGWAPFSEIITATEADELSAIYPQEQRFRKRVVLQQHGFGRGEYKYLKYPMPPLVTALRKSFYPYLAKIGNNWNERLGREERFPSHLETYLRSLRPFKQVECTPSLLNYVGGDYNCYHQDKHGDHMFPLQVVILLDEPGKDFEGGQFIMSEQRPRLQTRGIVAEPFSKGDAIMFTANIRPVRGQRGEYQVKMRHGVNRVWSGHRRTLGIMFHDAL